MSTSHRMCWCCCPARTWITNNAKQVEEVNQNPTDFIKVCRRHECKCCCMKVAFLLRCADIHNISQPSAPHMRIILRFIVGAHVCSKAETRTSILIVYISRKFWDDREGIGRAVPLWTTFFLSVVCVEGLKVLATIAVRRPLYDCHTVGNFVTSTLGKLCVAPATATQL